MQILVGDRWTDGFADLARSATQVRIEVLALHNLERLAGLYPVRPRDLRMVWSYAKEIGPRDTLRKVVSRTSERFRNMKYLSCGFGRVIEAPLHGRHAVGDPVVFIDPIGPACAERVVLPEVLLRSVDPASLPEFASLDDDSILHQGVGGDADPWWAPLRGWHPESGTELSPLGVSVALKDAFRTLSELDWSNARKLPRSAGTANTVLRPSVERKRRVGKKSAVLFGYGNYAKTIILPRVAPHLDVERVHEIDPTQIPLSRRDGFVWDTSPRLGADERPDAVIIAGYHHSHASLAAEALRRGAATVIEKPLATTRAQLRGLLSAMRGSDAPVFSGFQRRYLPFNNMARGDLGVHPGDPISYHAVVFEVPLPSLHWYRWPNSQSRLLSNGCHWLDHFLYLNEWAAVSDYDLMASPDGQLNCSVVLENGAFMSMVLTDQGSRRLGVRDHVELRAGSTTVTIEDCSRYRSENASRVLRKKSMNRLDAYRVMYDVIGKRIAASDSGDSMLSVQRSTGLALDLEDRLRSLSRPTLGAGTVPVASSRVFAVAN